jgi:hypothetical protein
VHEVADDSLHHDTITDAIRANGRWPRRRAPPQCAAMRKSAPSRSAGRLRWIWLLAIAATAFAAAAVATRLVTAGSAEAAPAALKSPPPAAAPAAPPVAQTPAAPDPAGDRFDGFRGTTVRFASVDEAKALLGADDAWVAQTGELQRASLMGQINRPAPREAFRAFLAQQALAWPPEQRRRWQAALAQVAPAFERLGIRLPKDVLIVYTTGRESADTPHTRLNAVFLPRQFDQQQYSDVELMAHELWHVASRPDPALRTRVYAAIGFVPAPPLEFPAAWLAARLANQDATHHEHMMWVSLQGRTVALMPVMVADAAELRGAGATIVSAAQARLLEVIPGSGGVPTRAVMRGGQPVWHDPEQTPAYLDKLGGNSDYLTHPEETLADNIMFMVSGRKVPNPGLQDRIRAAIMGR